ncbi:MAG TPA: hypothetical protein VFA92_12025, partial [Candidatus Binatia bacterium]|nr:hypothetical protein [Candidatus Binatia bacterium]
MVRRAAVPAELTRGPFTVAEAERAGLTRRQLEGRSWRRLGAGLYAWAGLPDTPALLLAAVQRRLPAGAAFSGRTAAWLHGLDLPPCDPVEVTVPERSGISTRAGARVRRAALPAGDVVTQRGMPATSPLRTIADLGGSLPLVEAVVVADMALQHRLVDEAALHAYVAAPVRHKGSVRLQQVVDLA